MYKPSSERPIAYWLLVCCTLVFAMVVVGGVTRLTGSGLSIVEWQPVYGILPPLTDADWLDLFSKYQLSPEFQHVNYHFGVEEFKSIFWLEYWHRVLGRLIGLVFFLPLRNGAFRARESAVAIASHRRAWRNALNRPGGLKFSGAGRLTFSLTLAPILLIIEFLRYPEKSGTSLGWVDIWERL